MASVEIKVPQLSESVAEATMLTWKKKVGDVVMEDEILIEIETDKVVLEVPAPASGILSELVVQDGALVVSDQVIAKIDTEGKGTVAVAVAAVAVVVVVVFAFVAAWTVVAVAAVLAATTAACCCCCWRCWRQCWRGCCRAFGASPRGRSSA